MMGGHNSRRDGQAQSAAAAFPGTAAIEPDKSFENPFPVRLRNGVAVIVDRDDDPVPGGVQVLSLIHI